MKMYRLECPPAPPRQGGFTLVELMIVVAIVGILAAVAYPSFIDSVDRAARTEAKASLSDSASRQEQFYLNNKTYTTTVGTGGLNMETTTDNGDFTITAAAMTGKTIANSYIITATRTDATKDTDCTTLTLDSLGDKASANSGGTATTECWDK